MLYDGVVPFEEYVLTPLPADMCEVLDDEVWEEFNMGCPPSMPDHKWRDVMSWPDFLKQN